MLSRVRNPLPYPLGHDSHIVMWYSPAEVEGEYWAGHHILIDHADEGRVGADGGDGLVRKTEQAVKPGQQEFVADVCRFSEQLALYCESSHLHIIQTFTQFCLLRFYFRNILIIQVARLFKLLYPSTKAVELRRGIIKRIIERTYAAQD